VTKYSGYTVNARRRRASSTILIQPSGLLGAYAVSPRLELIRFLHLLALFAGEMRACCLHLSEPRQVGIAQYQADVGVGDQPALAVDHVGVTVRANLDLRDHIPDQLKVYLGNRHAAVSNATGERERQVGF
jgi:hypothetical protein